MKRTHLAELVMLMAILLAGTCAGTASQEPEKAAGFSTTAKADAAQGVPAQAEPTMGSPVLQRRDARYRLCKGDIVALDFPLIPAFNQALTVQPDGYITLHGIGDLHVEGMTVPELVRALETRYGKILKDPIVTVELRDFARPSFVASGEVERPGKYDLRGATTVTEAIAIAGGFKNSARPTQVLVFRRVSDDWVQVKTLNMSKLVRAASLRENIELQPGDILFVPKNRISLIKDYIPRLSVGLYSGGF